MKSDDTRAVSRRDFLAKSALGAGGVAAGTVQAAAQSAAANGEGAIRRHQGSCGHPEIPRRNPGSGQLRKGDDGRADFCQGLQGRGAGRADVLPGQLHGHRGHRHGGRAGVRRPDRRRDVRRRRRLHPGDRRGRGDLRHRRAGVFAADDGVCVGLLQQHAAAAAGEQRPADQRGSVQRRPDADAAADDRGPQEVGQASDHAEPRLGVRLVCVPRVEIGRAGSGAPRLPGRGGQRALYRSVSVGALLGLLEVSLRVGRPSSAQGGHPGGRHDSKAQSGR